MKRLNVLFSLASLAVVLVTLERFSFTTRVLLQPHNFLRLHEVAQITILILLTVLIPFFLLREVSNRFECLKTRSGLLLTVAFFIGVYFYATGNGLHEVSSFNLNQFCDPAHPAGDQCSSFFFNDYYTGNVLYFLGGALMVIAILLMEQLNPYQVFTRKDVAVSLVNAVIYAVAIFAYAAFDRVLVGLIYAVIITFIADVLYLLVRKDYRHYPVVTYTAATYTIGTAMALIVRLR